MSIRLRFALVPLACCGEDRARAKQVLAAQDMAHRAMPHMPELSEEKILRVIPEERVARSPCRYLFLMLS